MRPCLFLALALVASGSAVAASGRGTGRLMAPAASACPRDQLTSYFGVVTGYKRGKHSTWLKIATDYGTVEEVTVPHAGGSTAAARFRLRGQPFTKRDWGKIESKAGLLRKGTRATAWVCSDGKTPPLIDWNGATEPRG